MHTQVFLVGLKSDLQNTISKQEAKEMAEELKAEYWEVSAKKGLDFLNHSA